MRLWLSLTSSHSSFVTETVLAELPSPRKMRPTEDPVGFHFGFFSAASGDGATSSSSLPGSAAGSSGDARSKAACSVSALAPPKNELASAHVHSQAGW